MPTIYIIGDSTVEDNTPPFRGWGWALPEYVAPGVRVANHAMSGRSSLSFMNEGRFAPVEEGMQPGDLLLIQFGHNDEKDDAERHTDPATTFPSKNELGDNYGMKKASSIGAEWYEQAAAMAAYVEGKTLDSYMADVDTDANYEPDTEAISDGYFHESEYRSAPYFDLRIDGITLLDEAY